MRMGDNAPAPFDGLFDFMIEDEIYGGSGNDLVLATNVDDVHGGSGNDLIALAADTSGNGTGSVAGGNGDDIILGSKADEWIGHRRGLAVLVAEHVECRQ